MNVNYWRAKAYKQGKKDALIKETPSCPYPYSPSVLYMYYKGFNEVKGKVNV